MVKGWLFCAYQIMFACSDPFQGGLTARGFKWSIWRNKCIAVVPVQFKLTCICALCFKLCVLHCRP